MISGFENLSKDERELLEKAARKNPQDLTLQEKAALEAAAKNMARLDPIAQLVEQVANDYNQLGAIFNEKAARLAEKNKDLAPQQQELPDTKELKQLIDAGAALVQIQLAYRDDQRKSMIFAAQAQEMNRRFESTKKDKSFDFAPARKEAPAVAPKP
jgi:hypothetical protein